MDVLPLAGRLILQLPKDLGAVMFHQPAQEFVLDGSALGDAELQAASPATSWMGRRNTLPMPNPKRTMK